MRNLSARSVVNEWKAGDRMATDKGNYYDFFDFRLDVEKQQLLKNGQPVQLTHKAFQILLLLVQNSGQTSKKEDIFAALWSDSFVEDANLTQHIYILRKVLGQTPNGQSYIETIPRQGYRFTLRPEEISVVHKSADETPEDKPEETRNALNNGNLRLVNNSEWKNADAAESNETDDNELNTNETDKQIPAPERAETVRRRLPWRSKFVFILLLSVFGFIAAGAIYYFRPNPAQQTTVSDIKSIAVLPFKPIGEEVDREKLGLGMADAIITQLSKTQKIEVRPTSTIFRYLDQPVPNAATAGRNLGVDAVLEGTIQRDGERIRVSVQLVRVSDGKSLWAETFHEKISDIFIVQDLISKKVASALSLQLTPQQEQSLTNHGTDNPSAFMSYQMGIYFWNRRTKDDLFKAVEHFQDAIENDPAYAEAYAGLADAYSMLGYYGFADVDEMKKKAKATAEKSLALNDSVAEAYVALAMAYLLKKESYSKAQELLERAVMLAPYSSSVRHRYGWILLSNGKLDEGVGQMRLAKEYDPLSPAANRAYCSALVKQRNFTEAVKQCETTLEIYLNTPNSRRQLARAYFYSGRYEDALNQLEIQIKSGTEYEVTSARGEMAYYYARLGRTAEAERIYAELKKEFKKEYSRASDLTLVAFALGKRDEAYFFFKEMMKFSDNVPDSHLSLAYDPYWDEIKQDQRFAPLFPK
jgi:TolB-like protein/DNA-binding winged helix-turn-helix (wHTH) protein/tetratricopeptide (TPR) repeat protein